MAEFDKDLLKEVTPGFKAAFIAYPWLLAILWFAAGLRGFFFILHCTGSAMQLFHHHPLADALITLLLVLLPIALWLAKEVAGKKISHNGHSLQEIWATWQYFDQHPEAPVGDDRWGKQHADTWIMTGGFLFIALVIIFSVYGLT